ncbi:hypothetical protein CLOACE_12290 [Clostridium acetireducens DSM 10703]|jgi:hypothetical protein|uniref:Uncharacterized protein n=1 Tax=Clostridium acetireducens DSM 10703 TaxID=1121290 RepID=A0A1E8EYX0_9CLOT|nr:hypothetical protein [Clostridium acetireducens]OFI06196.1 hypothetical protein CLOACE_12290 [Clostridium acetireducens DSM 10703]
MNINKAIKKQNKSYKRFMLFMCFVFFTLPLLLFLYKKANLFFIMYLIINEILLLLVVLIRINNEYLKIKKDSYKIKIKSGIFSEEINIVWDKVVFIGIEKFIRKYDNEEDFKIILISTSKFRNDRMLALKETFILNHPLMEDYYINLKKIYCNEELFYTIISKGKYYRYLLLDVLYRNCVKAYFDKEAINKIKMYREINI